MKRISLLLFLHFSLLIISAQPIPTAKTGIGTLTPAGKLHIKGAENITQLMIDANTTQSNAWPLIKIRKSNGIGLLSIYSNHPDNIFVGLNSAFYNNTSVGAGIQNTYLGCSVGYWNQDGYSNTAFGHLAFLSGHLPNSHYNTAVGVNALRSNNNGQTNTATGASALYYNYSGQMNTATGFQALRYNASVYNSATGYNALHSNSNGSFNTALGANALFNNTTGDYNSAYGAFALYRNTIGNNNTATGSSSLYDNTTGYLNTASGLEALGATTTGFANIGNGASTLRLNTNSYGNTACGYAALYNNTTGVGNTAIGFSAGYNKAAVNSVHTAVGYYAGWVAGNSYEIEIGNTSVSWIGGNVAWGTYSDKRIKDNIQSNVPGLSFITKLNPVTYTLNIHRQNELCGIIDTAQWEGKYDIEKITQSGFLAQEVEQAALACNYDFNGVKAPSGNSKLYRIQYESFVVPLVKAVQEQQQLLTEIQNDINLLQEKKLNADAVIKEKLKL